MRALLFFFFVSGFPALIYQIIWQRALFGIFGSNIEAVTLVVSSFMLGLGLGSLAGGSLSSHPRVRPLLLFGIFELVIGVFGIASLSIIALVGSVTIGVGGAGTFVVSFLTVLVPTFLMGATLPLLLMHLVRRNGEVGQSVSLLYSVNTWGSAIACFVGAYLVFGALGMQGSVYLAAAMNIAIGIAAIVVALRSGAQDASEAAPQSGPEDLQGIGPRMTMPAAILLAGFSGFVALSYEILWTRAFFLEFQGKALAFPIVLGLFLAGIALGASLVRSRIDGFRELVSKWHLLPFAGLLLFASTVSLLVIPALIGFGPASRGVASLLLVVSAAAFGAVLPLVSEIAVAAGRTSGVGVSRIYVANIVGSTVGTIVTGLVLLDNFSLPEVAAGLFLTGIGVCCVLMVFQPVRLVRYAGCGVAALAIAPLALAGTPVLHAGLYETLQFRDEMPDGFKFANVAETKSGVVTITPDRTVYGTGVYDGMAEIDLLADRNGLFRATALAAVHSAPKRVLVIGLSSAAWTQLLANMDGVEQVTAVEINPGYLDLIADYPELRSVLDNPKVDIVVDDGRRWLRRNPDERFDLIVANTTFHWRAGASNLLSVEFLNLVRQHLSPGGIYYYNTTSSESVQKTGASVFPHVARFEHFMFASEEPISFDRRRWFQALQNWRVDGTPLLDFNRPDHRARARTITSYAQRVGPVNPDDEMQFAVEFRDSILQRTTDFAVITDDNMGAEWSATFLQ